MSGYPQLEALLAMAQNLPASDLPRFLGDLEEIRITARMRLTSVHEQQAITQRNFPPSEFFSIDDIAARWRCSRGTIYNRLRSAGALSLDFSSKKQSRSKRSIPRSVVLQIEEKYSKRIS